MEIFPSRHEVANCVHSMALLNKEDADIISAKYNLDSDENNFLYIRTSDVCENGERDI